MMNNMFNPGKPDMMGGAIGQAAMGTMPQGQPQMQAFGQPQNTSFAPPQMQGMGQGMDRGGFGQGQWMQNHPGFGGGFGQGPGGFGQGFGGFGGGFHPGQGFGGGGSVAQNMGQQGGQDFPGQYGVR